MSINVNDKNLGHATAYAYYKAGGGTMTEAEFTEFMADFGTASQTAVEAAQAALASETAAQTAATTATNKATEATTAAQTATTKAGEASTSASTATSAKDTAVSASQTATTKATEATTAAATATSAKTDAVAANTAAQSAKTAAQTAQTGAETAAASVSASAEQIATNAADISQLKSDFADMQSDGVVPSAEQILTDKGVTDSVPYHYRKTGGDGADRLYDQIVGGSVAWNQLVPDQYSTKTASQSSQEWAINSICQIPFIAQHVVLISMDATVPSNGKWRIRYPSVSAEFYSSAKMLMRIPSSNIINALSVQLWSLDGNDATFAFEKIMAIDLTTLFGPTIADYIYQLEQTTAGAGVAFFKSLFPNDYYPYNSSELVSVSGLSEHKMVGFNQWDEVAEVGLISVYNGQDISGSGIRAKNMNQCFPNTDYYFKGVQSTSYVFWYDSDGNYINNAARTSDGTVTSPTNARYFRLRIDGATTYNHDICINLSDASRNGEYEPYKAHSYPLDSTLTLRGIPKLDANNQLYYDGDTYDADGTVTRRYGIVDLGTLSWSYDSSSGRFYVTRINIKATTVTSYVINALCSLYSASTYPASSNKDKVMGAVIAGGVTYFAVIDSAYSNATAFKTAMSGVMLVYELATSTEETAQPYANPHRCAEGGTEEYVTTGIVPVGHYSKYLENLRSKIEGLPRDFSTLIAPTEKAYKATRNYTVGSLLIVDNILYKVTSAIANGGTITPNTNVTATTLAAVIAAL